MASNYKTAADARNSALNALGARLNGGRIEIRTGVQPASISDGSSGTLLASPTYGNPAFGSASGGSMAANAISSATAVASGDAGYFREYGMGQPDNSPDSEGTAGESADNPGLEFQNKTITFGGTVAISSMVKTLPEQ